MLFIISLPNRNIELDPSTDANYSQVTADDLQKQVHRRDDPISKMGRCESFLREGKRGKEKEGWKMRQEEETER